LLRRRLSWTRPSSTSAASAEDGLTELADRLTIQEHTEIADSGKYNRFDEQ